VIPVVWSKCLILAISLSFVFTGCNGTAPKWDAKIWAGHSQGGGFRRTQSNESFKCSDPKTDEGVWISYEDLGKLPNILSMCKKWKKGVDLEDVDLQFKVLTGEQIEPPH
jgi:hypothetical protein